MKLLSRASVRINSLKYLLQVRGFIKLAEETLTDPVWGKEVSLPALYQASVVLWKLL